MMKKLFALSVLAIAFLGMIALTANATAQVQVWNGDLDGSTNANKIVTGLLNHPLPAVDAGALTWTDAGWAFATGGGTSTGTAGQALWTNDAGVATTWAYPHGDVDASATDPGALTVNAIQGYGVSTLAPSSGQPLVYNSGLWHPWTLDTFETTHGRITAGGGGSDYKAVIGPYVSGETSYAALYLLPNATSPSSANESVLASSTDLYLNSPGGNIYFGAAASFGMQMSPAFHLQWPASTTTPTLEQLTPTSDNATNNIVLSPQAPYASALMHKTPGSVVVQVPSPLAGTDYEGGFAINNNGGTFTSVLAGQYASGTTYGAMWFGAAASTPADTNFSFLGSGAITYLNGTSQVTVTVGGTSSYGITLSGGTTQTWLTGPLVSSAAWGTDKSSATFALQSGDARTFLSSTASGAGTNATTLTGSLAVTTRTVTSSFTVDTTTTDNVILADCTSSAITITLPAPTNGRRLVVIDKANNCSPSSGKTITLARHASEKIDGTAADLIVNTSGERAIVWSDGTDWYTEAGVALP